MYMYYNIIIHAYRNPGEDPTDRQWDINEKSIVQAETREEVLEVEWCAPAIGIHRAVGLVESQCPGSGEWLSQMPPNAAVATTRW